MANDKTYNPYCLVNYLYYEITGEYLHCKDCFIENCEEKMKEDDKK